MRTKPSTFADLIADHAAGIARLTDQTPATTFDDFLEQVEAAQQIYGVGVTSTFGEIADELSDALTYLYDANSNESDRPALLARADEHLQAAIELAV